MHRDSQSPFAMFKGQRNHEDELMYEVGYSDTKAFRDVFRKVMDQTPLEYRGRYNRQPAVA